MITFQAEYVRWLGELGLAGNIQVVRFPANFVPELAYLPPEAFVLKAVIQRKRSAVIATGDGSRTGAGPNEGLRDVPRFLSLGKTRVKTRDYHSKHNQRQEPLYRVFTVHKAMQFGYAVARFRSCHGSRARIGSCARQPGGR